MTTELYYGEMWHGQSHELDFIPLGKADALLRQAAHDAVEITELKRENERLQIEVDFHTPFIPDPLKD